MSSCDFTPARSDLIFRYVSPTKREYPRMEQIMMSQKKYDIVRRLCRLVKPFLWEQSRAFACTHVRCCKGRLVNNNLLPSHIHLPCRAERMSSPPQAVQVWHHLSWVRTCR